MEIPRIYNCEWSVPALSLPPAGVPGRRRLMAPYAAIIEGDGNGDRNGVSPSGDSPASGTERLRALIVEDEATIAIHIEDMLTDMGVEVVGTALTAAQAVSLADAARPDFVTMDIRLHGDRDGVSAALEIYERFGIRSVFISAFGDANTVARATRASPLGWLSKPFRHEDLEVILRNLPPRSGKP